MSKLTKESNVVDKLIKVSVIASRLGYHPESIYRRIREGTIPDSAVEHFGRSIRLREDLVIESLKGKQQA